MGVKGLHILMDPTNLLSLAATAESTIPPPMYCSVISQHPYLYNLLSNFPFNFSNIIGRKHCRNLDFLHDKLSKAKYFPGEKPTIPPFL